MLQELGQHTGQCFVLVVRKDSAVRRLADLADLADLNDASGASGAFPAPNAFASSLLPRGLLPPDGIRIPPTYVRTHSNG